MRQGWTYKKLGEVATFINGYPFKPTDWKNSGRKIIRIQNLNNPNATYNFYDGSIDPKYLVSNGDVLISWSGSLGVFEWSEDEAILNQHIFKVVFNKGHINKKFFEYVVASRINEMKSKVHGVTMQHITKKEFDVILIPVPPIAEQERIVAELDLLSGIIEKKKEQLKAYDQLAQSIFYTMFGDPIDNPKGWEVKPMKDVCKEIGDGLHGTPQYDTNGNIAFINGNNLINGRITITEKTQFVNEIEAEKIYIELDSNTILLSINGTLGKTAIYNNERIVLGKSACYLRLFSRLNRLFVLALMNTTMFKDFLENNSSKSTIKNVGLKAIRNFKIIIPPLELQNLFAEKVKAIERQKALVQQSIDETQTMFDCTMDKYFG